MDTALLQLITKLEQAAGVIGVETVRLWPQLVAITFLKSLFWLIASPVFAIGGVRLSRYCFARIPWDAFELEPKDWPLVVGLFGGAVLSVIGLLGTFLGTPDNLAGVFYPEAQTVLKLAEKLK